MKIFEDSIIFHEGRLFVKIDLTKSKIQFLKFNEMFMYKQFVPYLLKTVCWKRQHIILVPQETIDLFKIQPVIGGIP